MSTPALNPRPSARRTTTFTAGSRPAAVSILASSNQPATVRAFTGGLSITTSAMPSEMVTVVPKARLSDCPSDNARHPTGSAGSPVDRLADRDPGGLVHRRGATEQEALLDPAG